MLEELGRYLDDRRDQKIIGVNQYEEIMESQTMTADDKARLIAKLVSMHTKHRRKNPRVEAKFFPPYMALMYASMALLVVITVIIGPSK